MTVWRTVLRVTVGCLFAGHGTQKLFGWFGGGGPAETAKMFAKLGVRPAGANAIAAGGSEAAGGALLAAGLGTPFAASGLIAVMFQAIERVHLRKGPWNQNGGYEYPAVLIATLAALVEAGPGRLSLDSALGRERKGAAWAAFSLGLASFASYAVDALSERWRPGSARLESVDVADESRESRSAAA